MSSIRLSDGREISYQVAGEAGGARLLLVHGAGGSRRKWRYQIDHFQHGYRVVALDLPGRAGCPLPAAAPAVAPHADAVMRFIDAMNWSDPPVFIGHSMGGAIGLYLAVHAPEFLKALVLVSSASRFNIPEQRIEAAEQNRYGREAMLAAFAGDAPPELIETEAAHQAEVPQATIAWDFRACNAFDISGQLGAIHMPTLVLVGSEDRSTPPARAEELASGIRGAQWKEIPGGGHNLMVEKPSEVNQAIEAFLLGLS